jgi:hypothetical protein
MMNREALSDQMRRIRAAEKRDPVENAFYAMVALSDKDLQKVCDLWNRVFAADGRPNRRRMSITGLRPAAIEVAE